MTHRYSAATHQGSVRDLNEDAILALPDEGVWVVADGMGGHAAGDFASRSAVDAVAAMPSGLPPRDRVRALRSALAGAHDTIRSESARRGGITIGAAVVALLLGAGHFAAFWAGDCRLYRLRDGGIDLLTFDHSVVALLVASGQMSWDEADRHPDSNAITRALGVGEGAVELDKVRGETTAGDRFLLCSDGLPRHAGFAALRDLLARAPIETVADDLIRLALAGGGEDNVSVIVVDV